MAIHFEQFAQDGRKFVQQLAFNLGYPSDTDKAARILTTVLHVMRDTLPIPESLQFLAQLPMCLKAVYVQNWKYHPVPKKIKSIAQFADALFESDKLTNRIDFLNVHIAIHHTKVVLATLRKYISDGEMSDIAANFKGELKSLFEEEVY